MIQPIVQENEATMFNNKILNLKRVILLEHTNLMQIWENPNVLEILQAQGTQAKDIFELSYALQMILKRADPSYEIITPYRPDYIEENVYELDEEGNPTEQILSVNRVKIKIPVEVVFNTDGSVNSIIDKNEN